jgi:Family of unknown function (DUF6088)
MRGRGLDLKRAIIDRMAPKEPFGVWTTIDFADLAPYGAVRQALHRLALAEDIRRIHWGLYDKPRINKLTGKTTNPNPRAVVDALTRRDRALILVDGLTAANDLGLCAAVPARILVFTDARLQPLDLGGLRIEFKRTAPGALYWAGHPAMRVVQALYWLQDKLPGNPPKIRKRLASILADPEHGAAVVADLRKGLTTLPPWMQAFLRDLIGELPNQFAGAGDHYGNSDHRYRHTPRHPAAGQ